MREIVLKNIARQVAAELSNYLEISGELYIRTPITIRGGDRAMVRICDLNNGNYSASHCRLHYFKDLNPLGDEIYAAHARNIAEDCGIKFDGNVFFVPSAPAKKICGAVIEIANAVARAQDRTQQQIKREFHVSSFGEPDAR